MTDDARRRAEELVNEYWSVPYDDSLIERIAKELMDFRQAASELKSPCGHLTFYGQGDGSCYICVTVADAVAQAVKERAEEPSCMEAEHGGHPTCPHIEEMLYKQAEEIARLRERRAAGRHYCVWCDGECRKHADIQLELSAARVTEALHAEEIVQWSRLNVKQGNEIDRWRRKAEMASESFKKVNAEAARLQAALKAERDYWCQWLSEHGYNDHDVAWLCRNADEALRSGGEGVPGGYRPGEEHDDGR